MEIWKYILEHDNGVTNFHFEISADLLREEELELMSRMRPGLIQLGDWSSVHKSDTIRAIHRNMDLKKAESHLWPSVIQLWKYPSASGSDRRTPYEGYESFRRSFEQVYRMKPDHASAGISEGAERLFHVS